MFFGTVAVDQCVQTFKAQLPQHRANFLVARADVTASKRINIDRLFAHLHRKRLRSATRASSLSPQVGAIDPIAEAVQGNRPYHFIESCGPREPPAPPPIAQWEFGMDCN